MRNNARRQLTLLALICSLSVTAIVPAMPGQFGAEGSTPARGDVHRIVAVKAGRLVNSKTGQVTANQVILIRGEMIDAVGPAGQVAIPSGAQVIDLSKETV